MSLKFVMTELVHDACLIVLAQKLGMNVSTMYVLRSAGTGESYLLKVVTTAPNHIPLLIQSLDAFPIVKGMTLNGSVQAGILQQAPLAHLIVETASV